MSQNARDKRPYIRPVTRIELSEKNIRVRWILTIVLVCIAAVSIGMGIYYALDVQPGWNEIQAACDEPNYSSEFRLMYDFSETGGNAAAVNKAVSAVYSSAMEEAYRIFSKDAQLDGVNNLYYLNRHVNEVVTVEEPLYRALELLQAHGNRHIFLAPVYVEYNRVFSAESDGEAMLYDPSYNPEIMDFILRMISYVSDESSISLDLLDDCHVRLSVSDDYLTFAAENGIEEFLDLAWMRNAFVADYTAERLVENGYTHGHLGSFDGYNRNLDDSSAALDFDIYDRQERDIYAPGKMTYSGKKSIVFLRDYPLSNLDRWNYRVYSDGTITSALIDPESGISGAEISGIVSYADEKGCAEILMEMLPVFFADSFSGEMLTVMRNHGIYSIWCSDGTVFYNEEDLSLNLLENKGGIYYELKYVK